MIENDRIVRYVDIHELRESIRRRLSDRSEWKHEEGDGNEEWDAEEEVYNDPVDAICSKPIFENFEGESKRVSAKDY